MKKVLILTPFSVPSKCGIWTRVWEDAKFLKAQGFDVTIFSSNIIKATLEKSKKSEEIDGIKIKRFTVLLSLGGSSLFWFFLGEFLKLKPDFIHTHGYRHPHSLQSLILSKIFRMKSFITTHAPFEKDSNRSSFLKFIDWLYDLIFGRIELTLYDNVIRISHWEEPYLVKLGINNSVYIPNGLSKVFTENNIKLNSELKNRIIFMGRIDPVKRLEWIIYAAQQLPNIQFYIRGALNSYKEFSASPNNLKISTLKFEAFEFINELKNADAYILPSVREALPFTLLEAMSQGVLPLTSNSKGGVEVITDGINGYVFDTKELLVKKIQEIYSNPSKTILLRQAALERSKEYSLDQVNSNLKQLYI